MQANAAELATLKQLNIKWTHENTNQCTQTHRHTHTHTQRATHYSHTQACDDKWDKQCKYT